MNRIAWALFILAGGAGLEVAEARDSPAAGGKMGFGVSLGMGEQTTVTDDQSGFYPDESLRSTFYLTFDGERFKFEPEIGFRRFRVTVEGEDWEGDSRATFLRIGAGLFRKTVLDRTSTYYGIRAGIENGSARFEYADDFFNEEETYAISQSNWYLGPAVGAEHFFSSRFSIGAEAQLIYTSYGKPKISYNGQDELENGPLLEMSTWDTRALIFVRWYP
jgi:hypothetical protein